MDLCEYFVFNETHNVSWKGLRERFMVMKIVVVMVTHLGISVYVIMTSNYGDGCGIMEGKM